MPENLMAPGGGLTKSKLALATAETDMVSEDATFYAGDKELKTGALAECGQYQMAGGIGGGGSGSSAYVAFNDIPEGIYRKSGSDWAPEIRALKSEVYDYLGVPNSVSFTFSGTVWGKGYTLGNARAKGTMRISGLPYARMTTSNANGCSASYSNGTLTVTLNKETGEFRGSGMTEKTVNWSITCTFYLT